MQNRTTAAPAFQPGPHCDHHPVRYRPPYSQTMTYPCACAAARVVSETCAQPATSAPDIRQIPPSYRLALWRNTTPRNDAGSIGIAFTTTDDQVHRFRLDADSAHHLLATLAHELTVQDRTASHSRTSSGIPSDAVAPQDAVKV